MSVVEGPGAGLAVSLRGVVRRMGRDTVLRGVDLDVAAGRLVLLRGSNGSGKTTLLRLLATRLRPHDGGGAVHGHDLVRQADAVRARVGLLGASGGSYPVLTARENLELAARIVGERAPGSSAGGTALGSERARSLSAALERVGLLAVASKQVRFFSSGMKKRLGLARQLMLDHDVWLLDEPHAALDEEGKALVDTVLTEARGRGRTVIIASHEQDRHALTPDAVVEIDDGRLRLVASSPSPEPSGRP